jgi:large subunit ribosomal protein L29
MKAIEIIEMTDKQLKDKLTDEQLALTKMKLSHHVSPLENPMKIRDTRRLVARLKTEIHKRELAAANTSK